VKKAFVLYRQNVMLETQCCLFAIHSRFPKLNVAGSIPVSRSKDRRPFGPGGVMG
jgi:hypothetical protein